MNPCLNLKACLPPIWDVAKTVLDGGIAVSLESVASAIKTLAERHRIIAEGAGASSVAAALSGKAGRGKVVCVVSGGGLDSARLTQILAGCPSAHLGTEAAKPVCPVESYKRAALFALVAATVAVGACRWPWARSANS